MATIKISGLPDHAEISGDDSIPVDPGNGAQRMTMNEVAEWLESQMNVVTPDWANRQIFTSGDTMTEDGYVYISCRASVDRIIQISVGEVIAARVHAPASTNANGSTFTPLVPVKTGDVVTCNFDVAEAGGTSYANARYFIPLRN